MRYRDLWVDPKGVDYRFAAYNRQKADGTKPLVDNPTLDEIKTALRAYQPQSVLEVGCGWGRLLDLLSPEFNISGCDISLDMLAQVRTDVHTFVLDIADPEVAERCMRLKGRGEYDVVFTRGVLHYLLDDLDLLRTARRNLSLLANCRVILWEHQEVCSHFSDSPFFECHPIVHKEE